MNIIDAEPDNEECIFHLALVKDGEITGDIFVDRHPIDNKGGEFHIEIVPKWRKRWVTRGLIELIMLELINRAKKYQLNTIYSTALTPVSHRLLEFAGFVEYNRKQPKTYYYIKVS